MKTFSICILVIMMATTVVGQTIDETNKNITGFNRIQTGSGGWLDIQLIGTGSSFKIHDKTTGVNWVKWSAGNTYTEFLKNIELNSTNPIFLLRHNSNENNVNADIEFRTLNSGTYGRISFVREVSPNSYISFYTRNSLGENEVMRLTSKASVGIGTSETGTHKLAVDGTIGAREIVVETVEWSDFVFKKDYELKDLEEVENFIEENNHLPDIPSEKEVLENGIQVGEMNAKLLQKIEELTLYMIEQNKETKAMKAQLENLAKENKELKVKITKLETTE